MTEIMFILLAYIAGTGFTLFLLGPNIAQKSIESTVDALIEKGFLRYKKDADGEIEILKWNDNQNT